MYNGKENKELKDRKNKTSCRQRVINYIQSTIQ